MSAGADALLQRLAEAAGLRTAWTDVYGVEHLVNPHTQQAVLQALGFPCSGAAQCRDSLYQLQQDKVASQLLHLVRCGADFILPAKGSLHYRLRLEDGTQVMGTARALEQGRASIPPIRKPGYHRLEMGDVQCTVAVIPLRAPQGAGRSWVLGTQVYSLKRGAGSGHSPMRGTTLPGWEAGGDYSLLGELATQAGQAGAAALAISPVHAMFAGDAQRYSPYAPSSRMFLNSLYADPAAVLDLSCLQGLDVSPSPSPLLDAHGCLDWPTLQAQRLQLMRRLYDSLETTQATPLLEDLAIFTQQGGAMLTGHACYEALHEHYLKDLGPGHGWQDWPSDYHDPQGLAVRQYAADHPRKVGFHIFLQWLAARSLGQAQAHARAAMPIGLIADMAVGTDPRGSHAWSRQQQIMKGVSVGAPPDLFQPQGQDWGLTAFSPMALQQHAYQGFIETIRGVLAYAGGMRVDHIMGLARMWLVPQGSLAKEGIYLEYPFKSMMDLLVLEAWRHQAVLVGENLGTVPRGFNQALEQRGVMGMNVLWFEQQADPPGFRPREQWPACSMAMASTHDLPTARGWWAARDIVWRERQQELTAEQAHEQRRQRTVEKQGLWAALQHAGLAEADAALPDEAPLQAMLAFVAGTPAALSQVSLEDLLGEIDQPNLPGAPGPRLACPHPNWRRSLPQPVEQLLSSGGAPALIQAIRQARGQIKPEQENA